MRLRCPTCNRPILSRRNKLCSFCQKPLPAELLFTPAQVEEIEAAESERQRARQEVQRIESNLSAEQRRAFEQLAEVRELGRRG